MKKNLPSICIVAQNAYGAFTGGRRGHVGGSEHQTAFLVRWLATQGYETILLTWGEGQADGTIIDDVRIITMCSPDAGFPGARFLYPRLTSLWSALRRADADIYYHNSAEYVTGLIGRWCRLNGRRFVYSAASDVACQAKLPVMPKLYERVLYRHGLFAADKIIVQSETQRHLLQRGFGLNSVALPMPCPGPSSPEYADSPPPRSQSVAWVGRAAPMKRLEWLLAIAKQLPQVVFHLAVATNEGNVYAETLRAQAHAIPNVVWRGTVKRSEMAGVYRNTSCLCCTSSYEGFPNTFLEAWSHGRPVVTSFDPDGLVAKWNLGSVVGSVDEFVQAFIQIFSSPEMWRQKAANARGYYLEHHTPEKVMPMIERELLSLCL